MADSVSTLNEHGEVIGGDDLGVTVTVVPTESTPDSRLVAENNILRDELARLRSELAALRGDSS
jgi:hypothetical protein